MAAAIVKGSSHDASNVLATMVVVDVTAVSSSCDCQSTAKEATRVGRIAVEVNGASNVKVVVDRECGQVVAFLALF